MKCDYCFTDAGDQKCSACGAAACGNHISNEGVCSGNHDAQKEEETPEESPRPKRRSPKSKPEA